MSSPEILHQILPFEKFYHSFNLRNLLLVVLLLHNRTHKTSALLTRSDTNRDCLLRAVPLCSTSDSLNCIFKSHWGSKDSSICEILTTSVCSHTSFEFHPTERQSLKKKIVILSYLPIQEHTSIIFKQATWCKTSVMNICSSEPLLKFSSNISGAERPLEKSWRLIWHLNCQHLLQRKPRAL